MDLGESVTYLCHHLALAGRTDPVIADGACARLHKASGGLPRALNNAAIAALIAAAAFGGAGRTTSRIRGGARRDQSEVHTHGGRGKWRAARSPQEDVEGRGSTAGRSEVQGE
jgi:hypothetical protein